MLISWRVFFPLKTAMLPLDGNCQEAERGGRVGPVTRERTAGPPPHEPVWIVGDQRCQMVEGYRVGGLDIWAGGHPNPPQTKWLKVKLCQG